MFFGLMAITAVAGFYGFRALSAWQARALGLELSEAQLTEWALRRTFGLVIAYIVCAIAIDRF
jgi:hypothetical protein